MLGMTKDRFAGRQQRFRKGQRTASRAALGVAGAVAATAAAVGVAGYAGKADASTVIFSWRDLMSWSDLQTIQNYTDFSHINSFTVNGSTPNDNNYELGGFISSGGGLVPVAYLKNSMYSSYKDILKGEYDRATLGIGAQPTSWIAVHKKAIDTSTGKHYIGILDGSNFTIALANEFLGTDEIEFNGIPGDYTQMPVTTTSGTLQIPSVNIIPEPATAAIVLGGLGAAVLAKPVARAVGRAGKAVKDLVGKVLGRD